MSILPVCPSCGFPSEDLRCPRCNALKVVGCSGSCAACKTRGGGAVPPGKAGSGIGKATKVELELELTRFR